MDGTEICSLVPESDDCAAADEVTRDQQHRIGPEPKVAHLVLLCMLALFGRIADEHEQRIERTAR